MLTAEFAREFAALSPGEFFDGQVQNNWRVARHSGGRAVRKPGELV
jgi:hypothetical protein